jgi:hypothetical protein
MFEDYLDEPPVFDDMEAGFDAAGADMSPDATEDEPEPEMSMEDMLFEHFLDQLVTDKQNSLKYQQGIKEENTLSLQEADRLRRKLGS